MNRLHSFEHLIIDSEVIPLLVEEGWAPSIQQFFRKTRVHTVGSGDPINALVKESGGFQLQEELLPRANSVWDSVHSVAPAFYQTLSRLLQVPLQEMRARVLHLKSTRDQQVLLDRLPDEDSRKVSKNKGCHLRLVAYSAETCSFGCIYCFANYNYAQPTTLLFDSPLRVTTDLQSHFLQDLVLQGTPIYLGSLADAFSPESVFFRMPQRMLKSLAGRRVFTVTKSPLVALPEMLEALAAHSLTKVVFSYSNLLGLERNLPYDSKEFPSEAIRKLVDHGIDTILLYKPVIPGINDRKNQIARVLRDAASSGIEEVSMGFLQMDPEMEASISKVHHRQYRYFDRVLTEQVDDERIPSMEYRQKAMQMFADVCRDLDLRLSFCQAYGGAAEAKLRTSRCACCPERWSS